MEDREIGYILIILAELFFLALLVMCKHRTETVEVEKVVERIITVTPTPTPEPDRKAMMPEKKTRPTPDEPTVIDEKRLYRATCYLATGNNCADGTTPREGICAGAWFRIGQDCIIYDARTGEMIERLECRDTGGHWMLQNDTAIDIYKDSMERALQHIADHTDYVLVEWVERGEKHERGIQNSIKARAY